MENTSTPIENLISMGDDSQEQSGMSASEQILQKYILDGYSYAEIGNIFGKSTYYVKKICA